MTMAISSSVELELVGDAGVLSDLAAGHAEGVDLLAADQVDLQFHDPPVGFRPRHKG